MNPTHNVILGYIGCGFLFASFIPQTIKVVRTNEVSGLSPFFIGFILMASLCLALYAYDLQAYPILLANISVFLNNVILLWVYLYKKMCIYNTIEEDSHGILV